MKARALQKTLSDLEQRFGAVTGSAAEANTIATYVDGFMDCLRWITQQSKIRDPEQLAYVTCDLEGPDDADRFKGTSTDVDIVIRLRVVGCPADVEGCREALDCLADVMAVQGEDGLWRLGHPDAESDEIQNEPVANILSTHVHDIVIGEVGQDPFQARCARLEEIAHELATIASHAVHVPGQTTAMDERISALVCELEASKELP